MGLPRPATAGLAMTMVWDCFVATLLAMTGVRNDDGMGLPRPARAGLAMTMVRNDKDATSVFFCRFVRYTGFMRDPFGGVSLALLGSLLLKR